MAMPYNIINCAGFTDRIGCGGAKLMIVLLFFILAILRKWGGEMVGISFSLISASVVGIVLYIILMSLTGSLGLSFGLGLVAGIAAGYGGGMIFGGAE